MNFGKKLKSLVAVAVAAVGMTAMANPTLVIDKVEQAGGVATVTYTASGLDAYDLSAAKLVFEITANGTTKAYTNATQVVEGMNTAQITFKPDFGGVDLLAQVSYHARIVGLTETGGGTSGAEDPPGTVGPHGAPIPGYVQLWKNGPAWATWNVGATAPEMTGYFFWWGDTTGYVRNDPNNGWVGIDGTNPNFLFDQTNMVIVTMGKTVEQLQTAGYLDSTGTLVATHDAARAHFGGTWRMPTAQEVQDLIGNTTKKWDTQNGVTGYRITGKGEFASKSIFIPAAGLGIGSSHDAFGSKGFYWSSTLYTGSSYGCSLWFSSGHFSPNHNIRNSGYPVRAVRDLP